MSVIKCDMMFTIIHARYIKHFNGDLQLMCECVTNEPCHLIDSRITKQKGKL